MTVTIHIQLGACGARSSEHLFSNPKNYKAQPTPRLNHQLPGSTRSGALERGLAAAATTPGIRNITEVRSGRLLGGEASENNLCYPVHSVSNE